VVTAAATEARRQAIAAEAPPVAAAPVLPPVAPLPTGRNGNKVVDTVQYQARAT
jgi:hypothetical protein